MFGGKKTMSIQYVKNFTILWKVLQLNGILFLKIFKQQLPSYNLTHQSAR